MTTSWPWLPTELIENIISEAWCSPLSVDDRITLMTSSVLVNRSWMAVFILVSSKDVHIPCASYADQYLRILREESPIFDEQAKALPDRLCRSLTFHIENTLEYIDSSQKRLGDVLSNTLYAIHSLSYLPNLRRVSIEYLNWGFDDIFDHYRLIAFPSQVTDLDLMYTFSAHTPTWLINALRSKHERQFCLPWSMPSIRNLSILGAGGTFVENVVSTCPNIETLITDTYFRLDQVPVIPSSSLVLRMPTSAPLSRQGIEELNLVTALDGTLSTISSTSTTIIIESGAPDKSTWEVWEQTRAICEKRGVRIVHRAL